MIDTIEEALKNFCTHQIREEFEISNEICKKSTFIAYVDIQTADNIKYRVYIAYDQNFIQRISTIFLEEDKSDKATLIDMALETANMIIGSAKLISEAQAENPYTMGIPNFEKIGDFDITCQDFKTIKIQNDELTIAIKEING
ncbi:chemotaxis protein CheX [Sulfurimonas sp.]|jgi:hypothetical protein|uniref:chemotaxis protein CheX n=1 Tax=Sulfurimonas sp. TaxID=2022749 RepID=UPI0025FC9A2A|nr:chemotaxis protein CheX [Sulfurimonas sp.]MBT5935121.1 chemotaxis protein CheX [Sulfurimonas sp.]